jgi:hypothetical protein
LIGLAATGVNDVSFLRERLATAVSDHLAKGAMADIGTLKVGLRQSGLEVRVENLVVREPGGRSVLSAPSARLLLDGVALLTGRVALKRAVLNDVDLHVEIAEDGSWRFSAGPEPVAPPEGNAPPFSPGALLQALSDEDGGPLGVLRSVEIVESKLSITDQRSARTFAYSDVSLAILQRDSSGMLVAASARQGDRSLNARLSIRIEGRARRADITIEGVGSPEFAIVAHTPDNPVALATPIAVSASAVVADGGAVEEASLTLSAGPGTIRIDRLPENSFDHDTLMIGLRWAARAADQVDVTGRWRHGVTNISVSGKAALADAQTGIWRLALGAQNPVFSGAAASDAPVQIDAINLSATLDPTARILTLDGLEARGGDRHARLSGHVHLRPDGPSFTLALAAERMPVREVLALWPAYAAPEPRSYLLESLQAGVLTAGTLKLDMSPGDLAAAMDKRPVAADAVDVRFSIIDAVLKPAPDLPPISNLAAVGHVTGHELAISAPRARATAPSGRGADLADGSFLITDLTKPGSDARLTFRIQSGLDGVRDLLAFPAFKGALRGEPLKPDARGRLDGRVAVSFPLVTVIEPDAVSLTVTGNLSQVEVERVVGQEKLENGTFTLSVDRSGTVIRGDARLSGVPLNVELKQTPADPDGTLLVNLTLDDAQRARRGINLGKQLTGPIGIKLTLDNDSSGPIEGQVVIDLTRAGLSQLFPGFQKPAGRPGRLAFNVKGKGKGFSLTDLSFDAGVVQIRGSAEVGADGQLASARFSSFRLSPGDQARVDMDRTSSGTRLVIRGNNLDARPFLKEMGDKDPERAGAPPAGDLDVDLNLMLLSGFNGEILTNAEVRFLQRAGQPRRHTINGRLGNAIVRGQTTPDGALTIETNDGGALLRFMDLYGRMIGGALVATLTPDGARENGIVLVRDFRLRDEPALRRVAAQPLPDTSGQPLLLRRQSGTLLREQGGDVTFTKGRAEFSRLGSRVDLAEAVIWGPEIGITLAGMLDPGRDRANLSGTFVPAFALNNVLSNVPLVGELLTGGRNEGLLGVTFSVTGRLSQPAVAINPVSALAPGIFRKLFEFRTDVTGSARGREGGASEPARTAPQPLSSDR